MASNMLDLPEPFSPIITVGFAENVISACLKHAEIIQ